MFSGSVPAWGLTPMVSNIPEFWPELLRKNASKPRVIFIVGPTACGKTTLAIEIAKRMRGEIISADSMQVYQGMDIGTAKLKEKDQQGIPHFGIDLVPANKTFNVSICFPYNFTYCTT